MTSFQIADCPTTIAVAEAKVDGKTVRQAKLSLTVRNISNLPQTARITIEPSSGAAPAWFAIQGAPATSPQLLEQDFAAGSTQTIDVNLAVPADGAPGSYTFKVRVTAEADPDNDFAESPSVSFAVPPTAVAPPPKPFPWWIVAAAAVVFVAIGVGTYLLWPKPPRFDFATLSGKPVAEATALLSDAGFKPEDIEAVDGVPIGQVPGTVKNAETTGGGFKVVLDVDPGVSLPGGLVGRSLSSAAETLSGVDVRLQLVAVPVRDAVYDRVESMDPEGPVQVPKDSVVTISYNTPPRPDPCDRPTLTGNLGALTLLPCRWQLWEELAPNLRTAVPNSNAIIRDRIELNNAVINPSPVVRPDVLVPIQPIAPNQ